jgi:hypothetical protein
VKKLKESGCSGVNAASTPTLLLLLRQTNSRQISAGTVWHRVIARTRTGLQVKININPGTGLARTADASSD